ncbi:phosphonate ABC transporter ATP-binding protein [Elioraea sp.]|uniref:phosphonate ABC transporter ATP-binding protein n=1 Tax=Elioraea sp. TaxID=2185103 RepID=UPI00307D1A2E
MREATPSALVVEELSVAFGSVTALERVSFAVPPGQCVAVIGPSGAGKSTLLRAINRLTPWRAGRIVAEGQDIGRLQGAALRRWRARAAMIFQQFNLSPRLDVLSNVLTGRLVTLPFWRSWTGAFPHADRIEAMLLLDQLGLVEKAFVRAERLSGGQQQRVAIARALMQRPLLLLADEPTASLDPGNATLVMETLRAINRSRGITVLVNLHNVALARAYADRIIGLRAGRIQFDEPVGRLADGMLAELYAGAAEDELAPAIRLLEPA